VCAIFLFIYLSLYPSSSIYFFLDTNGWISKGALVLVKCELGGPLWQTPKHCIGHACRPAPRKTTRFICTSSLAVVAFKVKPQQWRIVAAFASCHKGARSRYHEFIGSCYNRNWKLAKRTHIHKCFRITYTLVSNFVLQRDRPKIKALVRKPPLPPGQLAPPWPASLGTSINKFCHFNTI